MNKFNGTLRRLLCGSAARDVNGAMALAVVLAICPTSAFPETQVRGSAEAVRIEVKNASIEEILTALHNSFGLQYQSTGKLEKQVTGSYAGPLQRVLVRLLEGNNFFLKSVDGRIEVTVLAPRQPTLNATASSPAPASSKAATKAPAGTTAPAATPPAATATRTQLADAQAPTAPSAAPPSLVIKDADDSAPLLLAPSLVAEGPTLVPSAPQGSAAPTLEPKPSSVAPPTASSTSVQAPVPSPTSIAPPAPPPAKPAEIKPVETAPSPQH
jgi:hypothetical protein